MNKNSIVSLMVSADWHIGATDPFRFKKEFITLFKTTLEEKGGLDLFIVSGDTFDMKEYLSSDSVKVFFLIIAELLELTKEYGTQFRFIEGTRTHDALQLSTLKIVFENLLQNNRVKFIEEVTEENILGLDILYIPEEYIIDSKKYYEQYFSKHYDFIFGHGNTDLMWYMNKGKNVKGSQAPVFKANELCEVANYSYFGHFHYRIESGIDKRFKSIGPVSRWEFGKDSDCGFYYVEYDTKTKVALEDYIYNIYAPILPTVTMSIKKDYDLEILNKKIIDKLNSVDENADKTRIIINIDSTLETFIIMRDFILASYGNNDKISIMLKIVGNNDEEETSEDIETSIEKSIEDKPYLYDKTMHDEARIASFIRKKEGVNISLESILNVIQKKDTKIGI